MMMYSLLVGVCPCGSNIEHEGDEGEEVLALLASMPSLFSLCSVGSNPYVVEVDDVVSTKLCWLLLLLASVVCAPPAKKACSSAKVAVSALKPVVTGTWGGGMPLVIGRSRLFPMRRKPKHSAQDGSP